MIGVLCVKFLMGAHRAMGTEVHFNQSFKWRTSEGCLEEVIFHFNF